MTAACATSTAPASSSASDLTDGAASALLRAAIRQMPMSGMRLRQMLLVASSIAKLADAPHITAAALAEAISYRPRPWGEEG
ncbi:hypothetical protein EKD04_025550 [Chloroflexales bacterium ZM16-3]|nr:hypothetical protein [Chloroflexales bacterium ZM16-3]